MSLKSFITKNPFRSNVPVKNRVPALVNVYRSKRPVWRPVVPNVASAPFGIQQETVLNVIGDNAMDGKSFVFPLQKLEFKYCDVGGSSQGTRLYIQSKLIEFATQNPQFEIVVQPRPHRHPQLVATYDNGFTKNVCLRNMKPGEVHKWVVQYRNSGAMSPIKPKFPVFSKNPSIRGLWSPFKDPQLRLGFKPQRPQHLYSNNF